MSTGQQAARPALPEEGGEPACMLPLLCPSCGRVPDGPRSPVCAACGAPVADGPTTGSPG